MESNQSANLTSRDLEFLQDFMNVSERLLFSHVSEGNDSVQEFATDEQPPRKQEIDLLGVVIFVVCGHFFLKWFFTVFSCFERCIIPRENPVRSLKFLYLLFVNLVLYSCLW